MSRFSYRGFYKTTDAEVEIVLDDIIEFITDYATKQDLIEIRDAVGANSSFLGEDSLDGGYVLEEKETLLKLAAKKYTLEELEQRLGGNKFDLL